MEDLRYALRRLGGRPLFAMSSVVILTLGMTSSAAVFTYLDNFYQPFPGADAEGLANVYLSTDEEPYRTLSYPDFLDLSASDGLGENVAGSVVGFGASVRFEELAEVAFGEAVTGSWFRLLGVRPAVGRALTPADDTPGAEPTVVLSHAYWLNRYDGDPGAVGGEIILNGEPYTIVGVAPRAFLGTDASRRPDFWIPFEQYRRVYWARSNRASDREAAGMSVTLRPPGSMEAASEALSALGLALDAEYRLESGPRRFLLEPATWIHPSTRATELPTVWLWLAAGTGLLLLACANVANLVLASSARRGPEMALRSALGASSGRLFRQLLTESVLLAGAAGVLTVLLAGPASRRLGSYFARPSVWGTNVPRTVEADGSVVLFVVLAALLTGVLVGVLPAWRGSRDDLSSALRDEGRATDGGFAPGWLRFGVRDALVTGQIALSLVLLVVAGLVLRTLGEARSVEAGFDTRSTIATYVSTSSIGTPVEERHRFYEELETHFRELPWVASVAVADYAPLSPHTSVLVRSDASEELLTVPHTRVFDGYFEALDVDVLRGRAFQVGDSVGAELVAVVSESMASRAFGTSEAVGRQLWWRPNEDEDEVAARVVGVVGDARFQTLLGAPEPVLYLPLAQHYSAPGNSVLVSTSEDPRAMVPLVEQELRAVDPRIAIVNVLPYADVVDGYLYQQRMNAELFTLVAFLGALLACVGIFAITSLAVSARRREMGIRVALGASRPEIVRSLTRHVLLSTAVGLLLGLPAAWLAGRAAAGLLYGVRPTDPTSYVLAAGALLVATLLAVIAPTRRALHMDPVRSLRAE